jgi:hypothetical protein
MTRYKREDKVVEIKEVNVWLEEVTNGWNIINYIEVPAHKPSFIRVQVLLEKIEEPKKEKERLFS